MPWLFWEKACHLLCGRRIILLLQKQWGSTYKCDALPEEVKVAVKLISVEIIICDLEGNRVTTGLEQEEIK